MLILGGFVGFTGLLCVILWGLVIYRSGGLPFNFPSNQTLTALAASRADCQKLIDRALTASSNLCNKIGSDQACYGNNTVSARLVPGSGLQFSAPGDIIGVNQIESISASVLNPTLNQWGIAIFKVISNLPRSLPGETITLVVFGNTTLENSGSLETYYFYSGLGQVACDQIPFDGLMVTMPEGTGIHFVVNGSELTLMGNASLKAARNGSMEVSLYSGSGSIESDGQQQIFTAGEKVSVPLGGSNGTDPIGPPSTPQPLSPDDIAVTCSLTGTYCDPSEITPVPSDVAVQQMLTANALTITPMPTPTFTPSPSVTSSPSATRTGTATSTPSTTSTPTKTSTRTFTPTRSRTQTPPAPTAATTTLTRTPSATPIPPTITLKATDTDTPTFTPVIPTNTFTPVIPTNTFTPTPGTVVVSIIVPAANGDHISDHTQTGFQATAHDTAVGSNDGDGIDHVDFWFSGPDDFGHPAGNPHTENHTPFCSFNSAGPNCHKLSAEEYALLPSGTYTMYVQATSDSDVVSGVITRTFFIP